MLLTLCAQRNLYALTEAQEALHRPCTGELWHLPSSHGEEGSDSPGLTHTLLTEGGERAQE